MMSQKKSILPVLIWLIFGCLVHAQVGMGTKEPHASADLELGSEDKALLLNRVADLSTITDAQDGMIVYHTVDNCVKAYENGAWSDCLTSSGGSSASGVSGMYWYASTIRFRDFSVTSQRNNQDNHIAAISNDNNLYMWGLDWNDAIAKFPDGVEDIPALRIAAPVKMDFPNFENNVAQYSSAARASPAHWVLTLDGKIYTWGNANVDGRTGSGSQFIPGEVAAPAGATKWVKLAKRKEGGTLELFQVSIADDGNAYFTGSFNFGSAYLQTPQKIALPTGAPVGFEYVDAWIGNKLFLKGNNGKIYITVRGSTYDAPLSFNSADPRNAANIYEINLPYLGTGAGFIDDIIQVEATGNNAAYLDSDGEIYASGFNAAHTLVNSPIQAKMFTVSDDAQFTRLNNTAYLLYPPKLTVNNTGKKIVHIHYTDYITATNGRQGMALWATMEDGTLYVTGSLNDHNTPDPHTTGFAAFQMSYSMQNSILTDYTAEWLPVGDVNDGNSLRLQKASNSHEDGYQRLMLDKDGVIWGIGLNDDLILGQSQNGGIIEMPEPILNSIHATYIPASRQ